MKYDPDEFEHGRWQVSPTMGLLRLASLVKCLDADRPKEAPFDFALPTFGAVPRSLARRLGRKGTSSVSVLHSSIDIENCVP
jgi:hypothetical protein